MIDPDSPNVTDVKVSIVICTKDRVDDLNRTLRSIREQQRLPDEVLIVDASKNRLVEDGLEAGDLVLHYLHTDEPGLTKQRNLGIAAAIGDVIIFFERCLSS